MTNKNGYPFWEGVAWGFRYQWFFLRYVLLTIQCGSPQFCLLVVLNPINPIGFQASKATEATAIEIVEFPIKHGDLAIQHRDLPIEQGDWSILNIMIFHFVNVNVYSEIYWPSIAPGQVSAGALRGSNQIAGSTNHLRFAQDFEDFLEECCGCQKCPFGKNRGSVW